MRADQVDLIHAGGTFELIRAPAPQFHERTDRRAFRAPFGTKWHAAGTGRLLPTIAQVRGVLNATAFDDADDALEALEAALPAVTAIRLGNWTVPSLGGVGGLTAAPTLTSWNVTCSLVIDNDTDWALPEWVMNFSGGDVSGLIALI